jgi:hypothetical protein
LFANFFFKDEIFVEHRKPLENDTDEPPSAQIFYNQFKNLLKNGTHSDITFLLSEGQQIRAHKAILTARSEYFDAMFRIGGLSESQSDEISFQHHDLPTFRRMLEFIYTNNVSDLNDCNSPDAINLLMMSNEFVLEELKKLCENRIMNLITLENIGKILLLSSIHNANLLKEECCSFIQENKNYLVNDNAFRAELEGNSELGLLLFESSVPKSSFVNTIGDDNSSLKMLTSGPSRKRRRTSNTSSPGDETESSSGPGLGLLNSSSINTLTGNNDDALFLPTHILPPLLSSSSSQIHNNLTSSSTMTNTIAQSNANVQDI